MEALDGFQLRAYSIVVFSLGTVRVESLATACYGHFKFRVEHSSSRLVNICMI